MAKLTEKRDATAAMVARHEAKGTPAHIIEPSRKLVADLDEAAGLLVNETSAKWWIDHRNSLGLVVTGILRRDLAMAI